MMISNFFVFKLVLISTKIAKFSGFSDQKTFNYLHGHLFFGFREINLKTIKIYRNSNIWFQNYSKLKYLTNREC